MSLPRIGVFDSGVGGLTVLKALAERLPAHYLYFGDTARLPYGTKSAETVARYAIGATRFLESQNIDLLVIACNTATALALPQIEAAAHVPVVGVVEPGAAMASEVSQARRAIVIATEATVASHAYRDALARHGVQAFEKACPLFVPLVEEGWTEHAVTEQVARIYLGEAISQSGKLREALSQNAAGEATTQSSEVDEGIRQSGSLDQTISQNGDQADVLVLACTHYPLITPLLRRITPAQMRIVDSAESTARVVKQMVEAVPLKVEGIPLEVGAPALMRGGEASHRDPRFSAGPVPKLSDHRSFRFFVTDSVDKFKKLATRFLGRQVDNVEHVDLGG